MDLAALRKEYAQTKLELSAMEDNPHVQFKKWLDEAIKSEILEPNAMVLGTSNESGRVSQRTVLLKGLDNGFIFYTNYTSNKARDISVNDQVSLLFPWYALERQVIIYGRAEKVPSSTSLKYFLSRPFGSQLGAWVSDQSTAISSRKVLEMKLAEMKRKFTEGKVPLPDHWGGYRVVPDRFEFWQGRQNRLHDRIEYTSSDAEWIKSRLSP